MDDHQRIRELFAWCWFAAAWLTLAAAAVCQGGEASPVELVAVNLDDESLLIERVHVDAGGGLSIDFRGCWRISPGERRVWTLPRGYRVDRHWDTRRKRWRYHVGFAGEAADQTVLRWGLLDDGQALIGDDRRPIVWLLGKP